MGDDITTRGAIKRGLRGAGVRRLLLLLTMLFPLAGWPRGAGGAPLETIRVAAPTLTISPQSGGYPQAISLAGAGFGANEAVSVYIDGTGTAPLTGATTTGAGSFAASFGVPNAVAGVHPIIAVGQSSGLSATTSLLVTPKTYVSASTAPAGAQDTLTGHGFGAHESVNAYWQSTEGPLLGTTTTYSAGHFTGAQSLTFTVPLSPAGTYNVVAVGLSSGAIYTRTLTVSAAATPTATPTAGQPTPTPTPTMTAGTPTPTTAPTLAGDWPMYLHDPEHSDADLDESILSPATVPGLTMLWSFKAGAAAAGAPTVANGVVYIGSWDGYEYAFDAASGALKWKTFLGLTFNSKQGCASTVGQGITSAATVQNGVVYVGGGDANWYALDAARGAILWSVYTGDNSAMGGHYNWSSPLIYNGYAYIGIASLCDAPLVQGQLLQVSLTTHQIVNTFNIVPPGQTGGSIWSSPAIDPATNTLYITTGNDGAVPPTFPLSEAMIALDASTLALKGSWQLPPAQVVDDSDFGGSSPVLFSDATRPLVAAINKNGYLYAFDRANISVGPVWERQVAVGGASPDSGDGSVSTGAFAAGRLYMAAYNTTINGLPAQGSVRAFDPATGNILWEHSVPGVIFSALAYANGVVVAGGSGYLEVLNAATGALLYSAKLGTSPYNATVYSLSVAQGHIYAGLHDGTIDAFGLPQLAPSPTATPPPDPSCPTNWACQDVGAPALAGAETVETGGVYVVTAGGSGIHGTSDQFRFLARTAGGDTQISAQVITQTSPSTWTKAGLMLRQSMDPAAAFYAVFLTPDHGLVVEARSAPGNSVATLATNLGSATPPLYLQIQRRNDSFVAATSSDGVSYTLVPGSQATLVLPTSLLAGLAVSAQTSTRRATAVFRGVALGPPAAAPATPTPPPDVGCPAGWSCADIGNFTPSGSEAVSGTAWTVWGAGQDLGGFYQPTTDGASYDELHFVWQPLAGDGAVSARVMTQTNTAAAARAGVMLRGGTDPGAPYYAVYLTPQGVRVLYRLAQGGFIRSAASQAASAPLYLEVQRAGNTFTAATSVDGSAWQTIPGTATTIDMGGTALGGVAVTSSAAGVLGAAQFDTIAVTAALSTPTPTPSAP